MAKLRLHLRRKAAVVLLLLLALLLLELNRFLPALAVRGPWMTDSGVIARQLSFPTASRRVSLVFRQSFPRRQVLDVFAKTVLEHLPNTVHPLPL